MPQATAPSVEIIRNFKTTPEKLFAAWVEPDRMRQWMFVSPSNEIQSVTSEARAGGKFSIVECSAGETIDHFGEYETIERPSQLVFTLEVPKHFKGRTRVAVEIHASADGCAMTFTQAGVAREITERPWRDMFNTLDALVAGESLPGELASAGFASDHLPVNGTALHYVCGGSGPAIVLLHGFPQDWFEYHAIMPRLAKQFTVIAIDLRGIGGSALANHGFDAANLSEDIHQLISKLNLAPAFIAGHDIGGLVAYALLRRHPESIRGALILDTPIPGVDGWDEIQGDPSLWHSGFMQVPGLAEKLVGGRQADYFGYFYNFGKFTPVEVNHHLQSYSRPDQLHAVFEIYRAFPTNVEFNAAQNGKNETPLFYGAGDGSPFAKLVPKIAAGMRARGCTNVETGMIEGSVHYVVQDQPDQVAGLVERLAVKPAVAGK